MDGRFSHVAGLSTLFKHVFLSLTETLQEGHVVLSSGGKVKRFWLVHFQRKYVQRQLSRRHGTCSQCGTCCKMLFTCPLLTKQRGCLWYSTCRPQSCRIFPIDQRDIDEVALCGGQCGYSFIREGSAKAKKEAVQTEKETDRNETVG